jgi:membrane protease YdiL (CAAX protease family)
MTRHPILAACLFEGMLIPLSLLLALWFGLHPWQDFEFSAAAVALSVAVTIPLFILFAAIGATSQDWAKDLDRRILKFVDTIFRGSPRGSVALIAVLAGLGEELLFRGVIQAGLERELGAVAGLLIASLLFGLAHFITRAYFLLATLMGIIFGLLYQWTGNLLVPVLVHALYDWIAIRFYLRRLPDSGLNEVRE